MYRYTLSERDMSFSDRYVPLRQRYVALKQRYVSLRHKCLSQTQMRQLACPKSIKIVMNGIPVARHGPILRENEATASGKLFKHFQGPPGPVFGPKTAAKSKKTRFLC